MTKTEHLNLPQWVAADPFQREDFNEAFAALDDGYAAAMTNSAAAVSTATTAKAAASAAQTAADNAAALAVSEAAAARPYAVGTYTGNGDSQTITTGFKPSAVLVFGVYNTSNSLTNQGTHLVFTTGGVQSNRITFVSSGFTVTHNSSYAYPEANGDGIVYDYIAFK